MADLAPGDVFAGHRIEDVAGRGGMGVVYRAMQLGLDRIVALKLITPALAGDPEFRARFVRESRAAASIEHPNVIPIFSAGEDQDVLYISMRFVDGDDLRALLRAGGPLEPRRAARIVAQVASALDAAHERGLVHRDVKPANILLTATDHAYLTDVGLTKRVGEGATEVSRPGGWVGTLGYVAPEQIRGDRIDARADVYALGAVLFHALRGAPPFAADTDEAMLYKALHDEPPRVGDGIPAGFDAVVRRALAKDPDDRYPSAGDLGRAALAAAGEPVADEPERAVARGPAAAAEGETVVSGGPPTAATRHVPPRRRSRLLAALAALALAAAVVVALLVTGGDDKGATTVSGTVTTGPREDAAAPKVGKEIDVGFRPSALVLAARQVWVAGFKSGRLLRVDERTGRRRGSAAIPLGTTAMAVGRGFIWIANQSDQTVRRVSIARRRLVGAPYTVAGKPVAIALTPNAVWVGSRTGARSGQRTQLLLKLDPRTGALLNTIPIAGGVENIGVGEGSVWVTNRFTDSVTRVDTRTGQQARIQVGADPKSVDTGAGFAWVASEGDGTITRIDPDTNNTAVLDVGLRPRGIAANADAVWASGTTASKLARIDPRTFHLAGDPVDVATNPFKLSLSGRTLWLAAPGAAAIQRVDF